MDGWQDFQTIGDEQRPRNKPQSRAGVWLSWICLVVFISLVGTVVAALYARLLWLLVLGSVFGWGLTRQSAAGINRIDIDSHSWLTMIGLAVAVAMFGMFGQWVSARYGEWPGRILTFVLINLAVGSWVALYQWKQGRKEVAEAEQRARDKVLRERAMAEMDARQNAAARRGAAH
jgi:hypothetical protein